MEPTVIHHLHALPGQEPDGRELFRRWHDHGDKTAREQLVVWGERDSYLGSELAEPDREDVPNLDRVERLPDASHWVHHDQAERVNQLLIDFFA